MNGAGVTQGKYLFIPALFCGFLHVCFVLDSENIDNL